MNSYSALSGSAYRLYMFPAVYTTRIPKVSTSLTDIGAFFLGKHRMTSRFMKKVKANPQHPGMQVPKLYWLYI